MRYVKGQTAADNLTKCAYCGRPIAALGGKVRRDKTKPEIDHIIPDKHGRGGCDHPDNKVPVCSGEDGCNEAKQDKTPLEYWNSQAKMDEHGKSRLDYGDWTTRERRGFLYRLAYWEAHALAHLAEHGIHSVYRKRS